jgi:hypothetical protein
VPDFQKKENKSCTITFYVSPNQHWDRLWTYTISKDELRIKRYDVVRWTSRIRGICNWLAEFICMLIEEYLT